MSSIKYCCLQCDYKSSHQHYINHVVKNHKDTIYTEKTKNAINGALRSKSLPILSIRIENCKTLTHVSVCFGCNKFWERKDLATKHCNDCNKQKEHREFLESLKGGDSVQENFQDNSEEVKLLRETIKKLERKLNSAEEDAKENEVKATAFDNFIEHLYTIIEDDKREEINIELKEKYPDIDWDDYFS